MKNHNKNTALRIALWDSGLTQGQFAKKIGMGYTTLNQILNARIRPRPDEKEKIARGLGVAVEKIFPDMPAGKSGSAKGQEGER